MSTCSWTTNARAHTQPRFDVVGVGNALVDVVALSTDDFLLTHGLVKGSMGLVDTDRALLLHQALGEASYTSGGSAANTIVGVASLGGRAAYVGKVARDALGTLFEEQLAAAGVHFSRARGSHETPTGRCIIVVTPDAERTMSTFLGISSLLCADDVDEEVVADASLLYMEGYLFDREDAKQAFRDAAAIAHANGRKVSLSLSDSFCVDRHRDDFRALVSDEVDLLFGNEEELKSLYEADSLESAIDAIRESCATAAITAGARGSYVVTQRSVEHVPAKPTDEIIDTTGAGDLYAAGFVFGYTRGKPLSECAVLGSKAAAAVIGQIGSRPGVELRTILDDLTPTVAQEWMA